MGLFDFLKKKKPEAPARTPDVPFIAKPAFYKTPEGENIGTASLAEGADTVLFKDPRALWGVGGKPVEKWRLVLVGINSPGVIKELEYYEAMERLKPFVISDDEKTIAVRAMTAQELNDL